MKLFLGLLAALSLPIVPASASVTHNNGPLDDVLQMNKKKPKKPKKQKPAKWGKPKKHK